MTRGRAVQTGSAEALFERPQHTFVGHFIGSPGMNFLPAQYQNGRLNVAGAVINPLRALPEGALKLGIRPEYVSLASADDGSSIRARVTHLQDVGTHHILTATVDAQTIKARLTDATGVPSLGEPVWLRVLDKHTCFYQNEELIQ